MKQTHQSKWAPRNRQKLGFTPPFRSRGQTWVCWVAAGLWFASMPSCHHLISTPQRPLRIALNPWPGYEFAALARAKGFFKSASVDIRLVELSSLGDSRRAFERGQVDGFFSTIIEVLQSRALSERRAQVVMVADYSDGADVILANPSITSVSDLKGRRIAVEDCSLNEYLLARALELAKIPISEVQLLHLSQLEMGDAFQRGEIDAAVTYPPVSVDILSTGEANVIFSSKQLPGEVLDVLSFDENVVHERHNEIAAFLKAYFQAQEFTAEHPEEAYQIMAARERIPIEEFRTALKEGIHCVTQDEQVQFFGSPERLQALLKQAADILGGVGHLHSQVDLTNVVVRVQGQPEE